MATVTTINPYNNQKLKTYHTLSPEEIAQKVKKSDEAYHSWRKRKYSERADLLTKVTDLLKRNKESYGKLMSREMGKPITQAIAEVEKCAWVCEYYSENAEKFTQNKEIETDGTRSFISYEPIGPVLAVMPWNYPFWQLFRFAAPNLMLGNTGILKHASSVTGCALLLEEIFRDAGFPEGVFQTIVADSSDIEAVIENSSVKAVTLTGSEAAGGAVASTAGAQIKTSVLELGGNNACIVRKDADLDKYMETIAWARFQNTGQSCIAGKRYLVHESLESEFLSRLESIVKNYNIGDPANHETEIGPMSSENHAEELEEQMKSSIEKGAEIHYGGTRDKAHFQPTILKKVKPGMPAFDEELFGPVASVVTFSDFEEAIELSNNSKFGLGVAVFTESVEEVLNRLDDFEDGAVFINELVKSDPRLPFGGTKKSGYGRELSKAGILEFCNKKTVYLK